MALSSLMYDTDDDVYYESGFLDLLDSHLHLFRNDSETKSESCTGYIAGRHDGDLNGFLDTANVPKKYHYIIMRLNDLTHTGDMLSTKETILIPSFAKIDQLAQVYTNKKL